MTDKIKSKNQGCFIGSAVAGSMGTGLITDDMQMGLFTAEGVILSRIRPEYQPEGKIPEAVFHSLLRWLYTQQVHLLGSMIKTYGSCSIVDGILMGNKELFDLRDPSDTCIDVLTKSRMGTMEYPPNQSTGPGALARNTPIGMALRNAEAAFLTGCECAVLTHGHPSAYLSAGFLSALICSIINGNSLEDALESAIDILKTQAHHEDVLETIYQAKNLSMRMRPSDIPVKDFFPDRTALHVLGAALFFALTFGSNFSKGLDAASERTVTTESCEIAGAILGALHGVEAIPSYLYSNLELAHVLFETAEDISP